MISIRAYPDMVPTLDFWSLQMYPSFGILGSCNDGLKVIMDLMGNEVLMEVRWNGKKLGGW